jgi:hypothetical protein
MRRSRSPAQLAVFDYPSSSTFKTLYVDCSLVRGLAVFFYVSCHPLSHSHSRIQSPILFFSSTDAILLQAVLPLHTFGGRRLATLLSRYVLEPIPPLLLRPCFSQPYCCCFKTLYLFFTQSTLHPSLSGNCPCLHTSLLSSYPPLHPAHPSCLEKASAVGEGAVCC